MNTTKFIILVIFISSFSNPMRAQMIEVYYPYGKIQPDKIDQSDAEYTSKPIIISGVVSGESQGGFVADDKYEVHMITLKAWSEKGSTAIQSTELLVLRSLNNERDFFKDVPEYSIVEFEVYLNEEKNRAVLIKGKIATNPSENFLAVQKKFQEPIFIHSEKFGQFEFNKSIQRFEKELEWNGQKILIVLQPDEEEKTTDHFETLENLMENQLSWQKKIDKFAVKELLPLKNESWLDEGEQKWNKKKFVATYQLESIWIHENGEFEFWHQDGDMFWGHYIHISGSISEGPNDSGIQG